METQFGSFAGAVSTKDWDALLQQMQAILAAVYEVATYIGGQFQKIANDAGSAGQDSQKLQSIRAALAAFRVALASERQDLIKHELGFYTKV